MSEIDDLLKAGEDLVTTPSPRPATRSRGAPKAPPASAGEAVPGDGKPPASATVATDALAESLGPLVESVVSRYVEQLSRELKAVRDDVQSLLDPGGEDAEEMGAAVPQLGIAPKAQGAEGVEPGQSQNQQTPQRPEDGGERETEKPRKVPAATSAASSPPVTVVNEPAVLEAVTRHALTHFSSTVALLGGVTVLFAFAMGMGYGYILGSSRYPWWSHTFASAFLGAPTGVVLLPLAGWALHVASNEYDEFGRMRPILRYAGLALVALGIALPILSIVLGMA
jgi:hypothetical protein